MRRLRFKSVVKYRSSTAGLPLILGLLGTDKVGGIDNVAVKCIDIIKNPDCEGSLLFRN